MNAWILEKQKSLDVLNYQIRTCKRCSLSVTRKHALVVEGNIAARIMFIALSPRVKEDSQNRMFISPSGQVLNKLLDAAGIDRELVFMTNLIKCILPKNRKPTMDEIESCSYFINEKILIIHPEIIVPLGYYVTRAILTKFHSDPLAAEMNFAKVNGKLLFLNEKNTPFALSGCTSLQSVF